MALEKMNAYYNDNPEIKAVVDGTDPDCNTCIFAFEGLGGTTGIVNNLHPGGFLKAMMVVTKGKEIKFVTRNASTLPDNRPERKILDATTTLMPGVYSYYVDDHANKYIALKPMYDSILPSWYQSSTSNSNNYENFDEGTASSINIYATLHRPPNSGGPFSEGCQTVYYEDYVDFGKSVGFLDKDVNYTTDVLLDEVGLNAYMESLVKTKSHHKDLNFPDEIKYILDRKYDVNNGASELYPKGIFYPHKEANQN